MNRVSCILKLSGVLLGLLLAGCGGGSSGTIATNTTDNTPVADSVAITAWSFAMVGDTHVTTSSHAIPSELVSAMLADNPSLVLVAGDLVEGGRGASENTFKTQLQAWQEVMAPLTAAGIKVYPVRGNHENDVNGGLSVWNQIFSGDQALPANGPDGETNLTYSFTYNNALFIGLDEYVNSHRVDQDWLDQQFAANTRPHVFVFGHEPAFKGRHDDCLDDDPEARNTFWQSLAAAGAKVYLSGHDHFFDLTRLDDGDSDTGNDLYQATVGTGGGDLFIPYSYDGDNAPYTPIQRFHEEEFGYLLVEIIGTGNSDLDVKLTWKKRTLDSDTGIYSYIATDSFSYTAPPSLSYPIVDTGQTSFYGNSSALTSAPATADEPFYGQDAQFSGRQPAYRDNGDGTISDLNTKLMWVAARGDQVTWDQAVAGAADCRVGGYSDWRLPTIKELYSLIDFNGKSAATDAESIPYIDTDYFEIVFGDVTGGRVIDGQDWSATQYVGTTMQGDATVFGVNFIDGRIKGYPRYQPGSTIGSAHYVRYVRGNPDYGLNQFVDNGDGTVSDEATGLMWSRQDSGSGMNWQDALAWVQTQNAAGYLGYRDWRLPNAKELQSLVDYTASPETSNSAAIDLLFDSTPIYNEGGAVDYPFYWTGTTHLDNNGAVYVAFGRALGWMQFGGGSAYTLADVHGAGAQRSDPKSGNAADYYLGTDGDGNPVYGLGPQGDVIRIDNFVRLVRDIR